MGREVRRVAPEWKHPEEPGRGFTPLHGDLFLAAWTRWEIERRHWERGEVDDYLAGGWKPKPDYALACENFAEWNGGPPCPSEYMPPEAFGDHYQMYETCSEGTPISPVFATPEDLARWLAMTGASAFGSMTASYEAWLAVARGGWAPSAVADERGLRSGVEFMAEEPTS